MRHFVQVLFTTAFAVGGLAAWYYFSSFLLINYLAVLIVGWLTMSQFLSIPENPFSIAGALVITVAAGVFWYYGQSLPTSVFVLVFAILSGLIHLFGLWRITRI